MADNAEKMLTQYNSPATAYQIILSELNRKENSKDEKIAKVFDIFDQLIPSLGVYSQIMKIVRAQFFDAVYSDEFTGSSTDNASLSIKRHSYFFLYKQLVNSRDEKNELLKEQLDKKQIELNDKQTELDGQKLKCNKLNDKLSECEMTINTLNEELNDTKFENSKLEKKLFKLENDSRTKIQNLEKEIKDLKDDIETKSKLINDLSVYKNAYDEINNAFSPTIEDDYAKFQKKQLIMNKKNQLSNDILNAKKLEEQILTLINISTEEYDKFIESQNASLVKKVLIPEPEPRSNENTPSEEKTFDRQPDLILDPVEKATLMRKSEKEKINFKNSVSSLKMEYDMIVQHRLGLEEKLYMLEVDREAVDFVKKQKHRASNPQNLNPNSLLYGLEEHYEPIRKGADKDQFGLQDRIFSKWACRMQTSENGEMWLDCKEVKFCENCGEKTLICPHKMSLNEAVIEVPEKTRYLRFSRPKLQYNQFIVKRALELYKKQLMRISSSELNISDANILTNYLNEYPQLDKQNEDSIKFLNEGNAKIGMPHNFQRIWYDFSQRSSFKRQVPRPLTYERSVSIIQQFLAYLHHREMYTDSDPVDIVESLYEFFARRYELEDIQFAAVYDFFSSINIYAGRSRFIELFCNVLIGNLDRGILNFVLYMGELIDKIQWKESEDVKIFFAIIYPYCDDDELDNLTLDFISFGENKINKKLVWDYLIMLILRRRENIVNEMEFRLASKATNDSYLMTEVEFCEAIEEFFFINDERQMLVNYRTALAHSFWDAYDHAVPISKLAHIAAYYCLIQIVNELQENIDKIIAESREKLIENEIKQGLVPMKKNNLIDYNDEFIKISDIDKISSIIREFE